MFFGVYIILISYFSFVKGTEKYSWQLSVLKLARSVVTKCCKSSHLNAKTPECGHYFSHTHVMALNYYHNWCLPIFCRSFTYSALLLKWRTFSFPLNKTWTWVLTQWECHLKMLQPFSGIILLLTHVHACMCDITAVCVHAAGGSGVKWISCLCWNRRVAAAPTSAGDVLLLVVRVTPCLCGFNSSLWSVSGFCIWLCGSQRNFSRECILRRSHKKASLFDAKL